VAGIQVASVSDILYSRKYVNPLAVVTCTAKLLVEREAPAITGIGGSELMT
jgi:hypothetical protein